MTRFSVVLLLMTLMAVLGDSDADDNAKNLE